jgi:hypothetical protein
LISCFIATEVFSGEPIKADHIPDDRDLLFAISDSIPGLKAVYHLRDTGDTSRALDSLTEYFKAKCAERYYFDWKIFRERFKEYQNTYPEMQRIHFKLAASQMEKFPAETKWILPFKDLEGNDVSAYELRHLARQQKSFDIALTYYYQEENPEYLDYFVRQVADLNRAFTEGAYDDAGNGIYEAYRGGRRIQNWLFCYNTYLSSTAFNQSEQRLLIRTFLHHGAQLFKRTRKRQYGNHHTKGLVALFEIAALFPEFAVSKEWMEHAINGLVWHISHEVNSDGFQFERSVHYHNGDIDNYFRAYQLALINKISLPEMYHQQFRKLFESLVKIAQPDRKLPVLQDDTDSPYDVQNSMKEVMILGTIVFRDPVFKFFSGDTISSDVYWLLRRDQLQETANLSTKLPETLSCELPETGYYIMRNGWDDRAVYMVVTAGLSDKKPDHQHGDMLGIVSYANGHEILPNYQVKYSDPDYPFFKNSWVKNLALVDNKVQGRGWKSNAGKSGFGKWTTLPVPKVIAWQKYERFDHFIGTHNGFDSLDTRYFREIFFFHEGFWIIIDRFNSDERHVYQQIWQGKFEVVQSGLWEKKYADGTGLSLLQIEDIAPNTREMDFQIGSNTIFDSPDKENFRFMTVLMPFIGNNQLNFVKHGKTSCRLGPWFLSSLDTIEQEGHQWCLTDKTWGSILIHTQEYVINGIKIKFEAPVNFAVHHNQIDFLGATPLKLWSEHVLKIVGSPAVRATNGIEIRPGETIIINP